MPIKSKKYLVTTRTTERWRVQQTPPSYFRFCPQCEKEAEMMTIEKTTFLTGKSNLELFRMVENHLLHADQTEMGQLLICINSLRSTD